MFGMRFLEISAADFSTRNLRGDGQDRHAASLAVIQTIDQMQISRPAAASADGQFPSEMCFGSGRECGRLFVTDMNPLDILARSDRVGDAIQRIPGNTVYPLNSCFDKNLHK